MAALCGKLRQGHTKILAVLHQPAKFCPVFPADDHLLPERRVFERKPMQRTPAAYTHEFRK